jgi:hypothetical protein
LDLGQCAREDKVEMARHHRLFSSYDQAITGFDRAIEFLKDIRCKITVDNFSNFGIQMDHSIGQFDFLSTDQQPTGVIQTAPGILSIEVKDCTNLGKNLGNLWESPTRAEVDAALDLGSGSRLKSMTSRKLFCGKNKKRKPIPKHLIRRPTFPVSKNDELIFPVTKIGDPRLKTHSKPEPKRKRHESVSNSRKRLSRVSRKSRR